MENLSSRSFKGDSRIHKRHSSMTPGIHELDMVHPGPKIQPRKSKSVESFDLMGDHTNLKIYRQLQNANVEGKDCLFPIDREAAVHSLGNKCENDPMAYPVTISCPHITLPIKTRLTFIAYKQRATYALRKEIMSENSEEAHGFSEEQISNSVACLDDEGPRNEEDVVALVFSKCDSDQTGKVLSFRIIEYLKEVTGHNSDSPELNALLSMLDTEQKGIYVDYETFLCTMKKWIQNCSNNSSSENQDDGCDLEFLALHSSPADNKPTTVLRTSEENEKTASETNLNKAAQANFIAELEHNNRRLKEENTELQKAMELSDEMNIRLKNENTALRNQIKSIQRAVSQAVFLAEELEEVKNSLSVQTEKNFQLEQQRKWLVRAPQLLFRLHK
nr:PREDICTED: uncharacterized protein LOC102358309 [Latimeria chalumnae]|eukprot:XP_014342006.1 PREDICTED: uncharacterized protein LOC102358309 [Latimeria chalumnae]